MKVNKLIAGSIISAVLGLQAWTLTAVVDLKVQVAELKTQVAAMSPRNTANHIANK